MSIVVGTNYLKTQPKIQTFNELNPYIMTGFVIKILPEDWIGNLEALRYELIKAKQLRWRIRILTIKALLQMIWAGIKIKIEDLLLPVTTRINK